MIDKHSSIPLYHQLKEIIKKEIGDGSLKVGDKLLSESEMIEKYRIGRLTVREALSQLVNEGYLEKQHGRGTFCKGIQSRKDPINISVLLNTSDEYFIPYYIRGINDILLKKDANFLMYDTRNDMQEITKILQKLFLAGTSGIILQPSMSTQSVSEELARVLEMFAEKQIPFMMIDNLYPEIDSSYVVMDDTKGGYIATEYLIQNGHKLIGCVYPTAIKDAESRKLGYRKALEKYGLAMQESLILRDDAQLFANLYRIVKEQRLVTALVCYNDELAFRCVKYFKSIGVNIPDDISIVGFDDSNLACMMDVPLTTIAHPKEKMSEMAAVKLLELKEDWSGWPYHYVFEPQLIIRSSVKAVSGGIPKR